MFCKIRKRALILASALTLVLGELAGPCGEAFAAETAAEEFTAQEKEYIENSQVLRVGYVQDRIPVSYEGDDGQLAGISRYIFDRLSEISGLRFEYVAIPNGSVTYDDLLAQGLDLITSVEYNKENQAARGILMSDPYLTSQKVIVARENLEFRFSDNLTVAISSGSQTIKKVLASEYPNFRILDYDSVEECLDAVNRGEADLMIQNQYVVEYWLRRPSYESLQVIPIMGLEDMLCFSAVVPLEKDGSEEWRQKELLISVLNKSITRISDDESAMYIIQATVEKQYSFTLADFLYKYRYLMLVLSIAFVLIVALAVMLVSTRFRSLKARADARAKGDFLSAMSHEIRTPLNGLIGLNYLMTQNMDDPEKMSGYFRQSMSAAKYLLTLVNDILDVSSLQEKKMELETAPVNICHLLNTVEGLARSEMELKEISFTVETDIPYPNVIGDELRTQQILQNLLDNACKFTSGGGEVLLKADQDIPADGYVKTRFRIRDNGIGMSEEFKKHIFDSFSQERETVSKGNQGMGLGMTIVDGLTRLMGGTLNVDSRKGEGSEFLLEIPFRLAQEPDESLLSGETGDRIGESGGVRKRVLVAEDNELNAEILIELLAEFDIDADLAQNGKEAVHMFSASAPGEYSAILMDLLMPEMDGFEASIAIRAMSRDDAASIRIIACTANAHQTDRDKAFQHGMDDFITKPIDVNVLIDKLNLI